MRATPGLNRLETLSALIVQDSIALSPAWNSRLAKPQPGFIVVHCHGPQELIQWSSHFQLSIAIVDKVLFQRSPLGDGSSPRLRRSLRAIARIDGSESAPELEQMLLLGCYGFVQDHVSHASLGRILRAVRGGQIAANRRLLSTAVQHLLAGAAAPKLTNREHEVVSLIAQRLSNKDIARRLFISAETLRWHLRNVYSKTEVRNRRELLEYAREMAPGPEPQPLHEIAGHGESVKTAGSAG